MDTLGHPVQLLIFDEKAKSYNLNSDTIKNILNQKDVRDCNIAVISCAGAFRKGKSFLLSFFIRYLNEVYVKNNTGDWLENQDEPLSGFSWKGGFKRDTTGIWIWSKIFTYQIPNGENVGVMLMDTQGTFDSQSSMKDNITIFALSTMLSSVQIFNLFDMITECDLQQLQLFTEYGKLAVEKSNEKPFQHLLFLIRDWRFNTEYGFKGGQNYFNTLFETENKPNELVDVRNHLKSCFQKFSTFLMPNPGPIAAAQNCFNGKVSDLDAKFIVELKKFIPGVLTPQNLLVKKINGNKIKCKHFSLYIKSYWEVFQRDEMPPATTILGATAQAAAQTGVAESMEHYQSVMAQYTSKDTEIMNFDQMVYIHEQTAKEAFNIFKKKAVLGDESFRLSYSKKLNENIQKLFMLYLGQNEAKKSEGVTKTIENLSTQIIEYQSANGEQAALMEMLLDQLEIFQMVSKEEKHKLLNELTNLRHDLENTKLENYIDHAKEKEYTTTNKIDDLKQEIPIVVRESQDNEILKLRLNTEMDRLNHELENYKQQLTMADKENAFKLEMITRLQEIRSVREVEKISIQREIDKLNHKFENKNLENELANEKTKRKTAEEFSSLRAVMAEKEMKNKLANEQTKRKTAEELSSLRVKMAEKDIENSHDNARASERRNDEIAYLKAEIARNQEMIMISSMHNLRDHAHTRENMNYEIANLQPRQAGDSLCSVS